MLFRAVAIVSALLVSLISGSAPGYSSRASQAEAFVERGEIGASFEADRVGANAPAWPAIVLDCDLCVAGGGIPVRGYANGNPLRYVDPTGEQGGEATALRLRLKRIREQMTDLEGRMGAYRRTGDPRFQAVMDEYEAVSAEEQAAMGTAFGVEQHAFLHREVGAPLAVAGMAIGGVGGGTVLGVGWGAATAALGAGLKAVAPAVKTATLAGTAASVLTMKHDDPGGTTVLDPASASALGLVGDAGQCIDRGLSTPSSAEACIRGTVNTILLAAPALCKGCAFARLNPATATDAELQAAVDAIHRAQFGAGKGLGSRIPMSILVTPDGRVVVSQVKAIPGPKARAMARKIFGNRVEFIQGGKGSNAPGMRGGDAEARGIAGVDPYDAAGGRQVCTHWACEYCEPRQTSAYVRNVTGTKSQHGKITRPIDAQLSPAPPPWTVPLGLTGFSQTDSDSE